MVILGKVWEGDNFTGNWGINNNPNNDTATKTRITEKDDIFIFFAIN